MVPLDIAIIGGGAQGLWLLNDLNRAGYRTILLERDQLGGGQTCHSHALIHRGHYYDSTEMMIVLNAAAQFWLGLLKRSGLQPLNRDSAMVGFGPGCGLERYTYMWNVAGLHYQPLDPMPDILNGGKVRHLFATEEFSVDACEVTGSLADPVGHCLYKLDDLDDALEFDCQRGVVTGVMASVGGRRVKLRPKMVVLCAGERNLALLEQLEGHLDARQPGRFVQARRKSTMICLRAAKLPHFTAVFPIEGGISGLFVCGRTCPDTGKTVWLVSDHNSAPFNPGLGDQGDRDPEPVPMFVARVLESLQAAVPGVFVPDILGDLEACAYTGLTSERDFGSASHMTDCYVEPLGPDNVLTIWPTKLTLTPFASNVAARMVGVVLRPPAEADRKDNRWPEVGNEELPPVRPEVASETWRRPPFRTDTAVKTGWCSIQDFSARYGWKSGGTASWGSFSPAGRHGGYEE